MINGLFEGIEDEYQNDTKRSLSVLRAYMHILFTHLNRLYVVDPAGGKSMGFKHGQYYNHAGANAYRGGRAPGDKEPNRMNTINSDKPLSNLYVTMLQKLGVKTKSFADSTGVIRGI